MVNFPNPSYNVTNKNYKEKLQSVMVVIGFINNMFGERKDH